MKNLLIFNRNPSVTDTIFVQIASYRDPQLLPTIFDCLNQAKNPQEIYFGICLQHGEEESLDCIKNDHRFRIIDVPYKESLGVCWARNKTQNLYQGETFTLQIDSHHRFSRNWDFKCKKMIRKLLHIGVEKPIITSYVPSYNPNKNLKPRNRIPWQMAIDRFTPDGSLLFHPVNFPRYFRLSKPIPSRFFSAHFAFTIGLFCEEVPYDPNLYFHGEEINISVRAYTHGYEMFHPHRVILWHEYTREGRRKHWDDHQDWFRRDSNSHDRNRVLLQSDEKSSTKILGKYGLGSKRTLADYEQYGGIDFRSQRVQKYTLDNLPPPNPKCDKKEDAKWCRQINQTIKLERDDIPWEPDYDFWYIGVHTFDSREIYRNDIDEEEIKKIMDSPCWEIKLCFLSEHQPLTWTLWTHSRSKGWLKKITKNFNNAD